MRKAATILACLSFSIGLSLLAGKASPGQSSKPSSKPLAAIDLIDSDEFFRAAIKTRPRVPDYSQKIDALLSRMTLQEKVGQMTQLTLEMVVAGHDQNLQIDQAKLQKAINRYGV